MHDVSEFLQRYPPFDALDDAELAALAAQVWIEYHAEGDRILEQGDRPPDQVRVVRKGAVELVDQGRVLDRLGPGELFGHPAMLSGLPAGLTVRAAEDTLVYVLPGAAIRPLLARPSGLRYVARSLGRRIEAGGRSAAPAELAEAAGGDRPAESFLRLAPLLLEPALGVGEAARRMAATRSSAVLVRTSQGLGIVTDRDLRSRVLAADRGPETPLGEVMSSPVVTVDAATPASDVLLQMLEHGVRHLPVLAADGTPLGIVSDTDLLAASARAPFGVRSALAAAGSGSELATAVAQIPEAMIALHRSGVSAARISSTLSVFRDALTRRALQLAIADLGEPPAPFSWVALGSQARRECAPSSDADSAIAWQGDDADPAERLWFKALAERVQADLALCGIPACENGAVAASPLFRRSVDEWVHATRSWIDDPSQEQALILISVIADGRVVVGGADTTPIVAALQRAKQSEPLMRSLARFALQHRPPTGFLRDIVVEHSGEHRGRLDLKRGGLLPIVDLARWLGLRVGALVGTTRTRLAAAEAGGVLASEDARTLLQAFELFEAVRIDAQISALEAGRAPDDYIDPHELSVLNRTYLKEAFRAVSRVQRSTGRLLDLRAE